MQNQRKNEQVLALQQKGNFEFEGNDLCQLGTFEMIDFKTFNLKSEIYKYYQILQDFLYKKHFFSKNLKEYFLFMSIFFSLVKLIHHLKTDNPLSSFYKLFF